jgi:hypothetical protein
MPDALEIKFNDPSLFIGKNGLQIKPNILR